MRVGAGEGGEGEFWEKLNYVWLIPNKLCHIVMKSLSWYYKTFVNVPLNYFLYSNGIISITLKWRTFAAVTDMIIAFCCERRSFLNFSNSCFLGGGTLQHNTFHLFLLKLCLMAAHLSKQRQWEAM